MPRIRTYKPDFFKSEDVAVLPYRARLTWVGSWTQCDDHGRYKDSAMLLKGDLWSLEDDVTAADVEADLVILAAAGRIVRYTVGGRRYFAVTNWHRHQAINRPGRPKYPAPPMPTAPSDPEEHGYCKVCATPNPEASERNPQPVDNRQPSIDTHGALSEPSVSDQHPVDNAKSQGHGPKSIPDGQFSESSVSPHGALTVGREGKGREGKGTRAQGESETPGPTDLGPEPPNRCPKHIDTRKPPPCGECADARRANEVWTAARAQRDREAPKCKTHQGQPAHNCALCRADLLAAD